MIDGGPGADGVRQRPRDSEKITINLGLVDLGRIDLLVREGFYGNRTDLIRAAIRSLIDRHDAALSRSARRDGFETGLRHVTRAELEACETPLHLRVIGLATIAADVTPELARAAIASVEVLGSLQASPAVKKALRDRMR